MSKNKSFFQKFTDSITNLFPFNSTVRDDVSTLTFENNLSPIVNSNRRTASVAFSKDEDETKIKRARLHYDLKSLPTSRIIKQNNNSLQDKFNAFNNNFNDTASDFSEISNVSVSTSGVSSLHPRSSKRLYLGNTEELPLCMNSTYPRNLNASQKIISPISNKSLKNAKEFISSPANKILEKLNKLSTPITASDKLSALVVKESTRFTPSKLYNPYSRPVPPITRKAPLPIKAVTISASSNDNMQISCGPIRRKCTQKMKRLGYVDDIDLDSESLNNHYELPKINDSVKLNFSSIPMLKKSISTNTEESYLTNCLRPSSPDLEFTFRPPQTVNDEEYLSVQHEDRVEPYQFVSKISEKERSEYRKRVNGNVKSNELWRCDTCFNENCVESLQCTNCENISKKNLSSVILSDKVKSVDKTDLDNQNVLDNKCDSDNKISKSAVKMDFSKLSSSSVEKSIPEVVSLSSGIRSSTSYANIEKSTVSGTFPSEMKNSIFATSNSKSLSLGQETTANEPQTLFAAPSISTPKLFSLTNSTTELQSSSAPSAVEVAPVSVSKPISFAPTELATQPISLENNPAPKPFLFGQVPVNDSKVSISNEAVKVPFGNISGENKTETSAPSKPFMSEVVTSSSAAPFVFSKLPVNETLSSSAPIAKPFSFENVSSVKETTLPASTISFNQPANPITSSASNTNLFSFGQVSSAGTASLSAPVSVGFANCVTSAEMKPFSIAPIFSFDQAKSAGNISQTTSDANTFSIGQKTTAAGSMFSGVPNFSFGQASSAGGASLSTSDSSKIVISQAPIAGTSLFSSNSSFPIGPASSAGNTPMFPTFSENSKPFSFGEQSKNATSSDSSKPTPFVFGQTSNAEVNALPASNSKPALFGQSNTEAKSSSNFLFGQSSNTEPSANVTQPSTFGNPGSFLFGESQKSGASSNTLFGSNSVPPSSYSGSLFGLPAVTAAPSASIEQSKPPVASFAFSQQPKQFGAPNSSSFSTSFSSTPQLNFSSSTTNQNSAQFSLPSSNPTANIFSAPAPQSNPFQFGSTAAPGNSISFANTAPNTFGSVASSEPAAAGGFNFNSNQPGCFQFNSGGGMNGSSQTGPVGAVNPRRLLKSRRKNK